MQRGYLAFCHVRLAHVVNGGAYHPDILGQDGVLPRVLLVNRLDLAFNRLNPAVHGGKGLRIV
jgi:hypothetical protein